MATARLRDYRGKAVVVTGGTEGIGLATGLAFGRLGASVYLTCRWGTADEGEVRGKFAACGAPPPEIIEADVARDEDTVALLERVKESHDGVEAMVANVSLAQIVPNVEDLTRKALHRSLSYSAWPFVAYLQHARAIFGRYPRYVVGLSSRGPEYYLPGYDLVAVSKCVMETYCRYLTAELAAEDVRINVVRANPVATRSLEATFGPEFEPFCKKWHSDGFFVTPEEVAGAVVALASGLMDGMKGQVLLVDRGCGFADNVVRLFWQREKYGI